MRGSGVQERGDDVVKAMSKTLFYEGCRGVRQAGRGRPEPDGARSHRPH